MTKGPFPTAQRLTMRLSGTQLAVLYALVNGDRLDAQISLRTGRQTDYRLRDHGGVVTIRTTNILLRAGLIQNGRKPFSYVISDEGAMMVARAEKHLLDAHERPYSRALDA